MSEAPGTVQSATSTRADGPITSRYFLAVVFVALVIAVARRLTALGEPGFPLGEGGLFILFSETILSNGFALPSHMIYNGVAIPFAYPPAAFYFAAFVANLTGADMLSVYYYSPIIISLLAVPAFCFLAAEVGRDRVTLLCASILYLSLLESFVWQITGGGLPRAVAALFALLAVGLALRIARTHSWRALPLCALLVALTAYSHLEWGMFASTGVALSFLTRSNGWGRILPTAAVGAMTLVLIAPWLFAILSVHGLAPFLSSSSSSMWSLGGFMANLLGGRVFSVLLWPAMLGAFVTLRQRDLFLLPWALLILLLTPRMGLAAGLAIPTALLGAIGIKAAGEFIAAWIAEGRTGWRSRFGWVAGSKAFGVSLPILLILLVSSAALMTRLGAIHTDPGTVQQLDPRSREAMEWIRTADQVGGRFVVISDAQAWWADRIAEWFPVLTREVSLTTSQGLEWAGSGVFVAKVKEIEALKSVQKGDGTLLPQLVQLRYCAADHVALFLPPDDPARQAFSRSGAFTPVFNNSAAAIFKAPAGEHCS